MNGPSMSQAPKFFLLSVILCLGTVLPAKGETAFGFQPTRVQSFRTAPTTYNSQLRQMVEIVGTTVNSNFTLKFLLPSQGQVLPSVQEVMNALRSMLEGRHGDTNISVSGTGSVQNFGSFSTIVTIDLNNSTHGANVHQYRN